MDDPRHMRKKLDHPTLGTIWLHCDALVFPELDQRVVVFTAKPRTRSARLIRGLAASVPKAFRGTRTLSAAE